MAKFFNLFKRLPYGSVGIAAIVFAAIVAFLPSSLHQATQGEVITAQALIVTSSGALVLPMFAFFSLVIIPAMRNFVGNRRTRKFAV